MKTSIGILLLIAAQDFSNLAVGRGDTRFAICDEQNGIRILRGDQRLSFDLVNEIRGTNRKRSLAAVSRINSAGVYHAEGAAIPLGLSIQAVTRGAGRIVHNGEAFT